MLPRSLRDDGMTVCTLLTRGCSLCSVIAPLVPAAACSVVLLAGLALVRWLFFLLGASCSILCLRRAMTAAAPLVAPCLSSTVLRHTGQSAWHRVRLLACSSQAWWACVCPRTHPISRRRASSSCHHCRLPRRATATLPARHSLIHASTIRIRHPTSDRHTEPPSPNSSRRASRNPWAVGALQRCSHLAAPARTSSATSRHARSSTRMVPRAASRSARLCASLAVACCHMSRSSSTSTSSPGHVAAIRLSISFHISRSSSADSPPGSFQSGLGASQAMRRRSAGQWSSGVPAASAPSLR